MIRCIVNERVIVNAEFFVYIYIYFILLLLL